MAKDRREEKRQYYLKNREKLLAQHRAYKKAHPENPEKKYESWRKRREAHPEKYLVKHEEKICEICGKKYIAKKKTKNIAVLNVQPKAQG